MYTKHESADTPLPSWEGWGWEAWQQAKKTHMRRKILPYHRMLKPLAKKLRKNMTLSEVLLWNQLKQKKMLGMDFDRQRPILRYIVDFYCKDLMLAIEVDGSSHDNKYEQDMERQRDLEREGVRFLRFENEEVNKDITNVLRTIEIWIEEEIEKSGFVGRIVE